MYGSRAGVDCNQRFSQLLSMFSLFTASLIALRGSSLRNPLAPRVLHNNTSESDPRSCEATKTVAKKAQKKIH